MLHLCSCLPAGAAQAFQPGETLDGRQGAAYLGHGSVSPKSNHSLWMRMESNSLCRAASAEPYPGSTWRTTSLTGLPTASWLSRTSTLTDRPILTTGLAGGDR
jgi:hypothetical protein